MQQKASEASTVAPNAVAAAVARAAPFAELHAAIIEAILELAERRDYAADETIYSPGQHDGSEFLVVESGGLKASHVDLKTGSMVIERFAAGASFALAEIVSGEVASLQRMTVTAEAATRVVSIDGEGFRVLVSQRPALSRALMLHFARALVAGAAPIGSSAAAPESRVFATLMSYVERDAVSGLWRIVRMPKHRELAQRAGVEEPAAANAVAHLIQAGVARRAYPGLVIDDLAALDRLGR